MAWQNLVRRQPERGAKQIANQRSLLGITQLRELNSIIASHVVLPTEEGESATSGRSRSATERG